VPAGRRTGSVVVGRRRHRLGPVQPEPEQDEPRGWVALVGDAASGATIGGQGNGTAMVEAYVPAGGSTAIELPDYGLG
jgi:hypothetical protein